MKIAVNTRLLIKDKLEGIGWFSYETLKRITQQHKEVSFYFIFDRQFDESFLFSDNITPIIQGPQARHPFLFYIWFELSIPPLLKKLNPDLFLSPDGYLSLSTKTKSLPVIHDLNFEHYPQDLPWLVRKYYKYYFPKFAKKATRIATVSAYSKNDIVNQYNIDSSVIDVVYNGMNESYCEPSEEEKEATLKLLTNGSPYFIFVGALIPRKNITNLFLAFDIFKSKSKNDVKLLVVGDKKWWTSSMHQTFHSLQHKQEVVFTGRMQAEPLRKAIGSALALTYVSYFEGFGIPILEAFTCHTPVITSNITSMPEIAGDAALLVDPFSPDSIADAMMQINQNENLRTELIRKGMDRKKDFSWQKSADQLWDSINKTIEG